MDEKEIRSFIDECMCELVGDTPVPCQLDAALKDKANTHDQHALQEELDILKKEVERLKELVGDASVAEQINSALNG